MAPRDRSPDDPAQDPKARLAALLGAEAQTSRIELSAAWFPTPLGEMICVTDQARLHLLEFVERAVLATELRRLSFAVQGRLGAGRTQMTARVEAAITAYFTGENAVFDLPLALHGTAFQRQVWDELTRIPAGHRISYRELAHRIGRPSAVRAVGTANGANQIALVIPCHRIVGADGALTGYGGGLWRKRALLDHEHAKFVSRAGESAP